MPAALPLLERLLETFLGGESREGGLQPASLDLPRRCFEREVEGCEEEGEQQRYSHFGSVEVVVSEIGPLLVAQISVQLLLIHRLASIYYNCQHRLRLTDRKAEGGI